MSISIPQSYVEQFSTTVHMLSEQKMSRLRGSVMTESVTGESFSRERLGGIDLPNEISGLHGDTPLNNTPHTRRWGFMRQYDVADLIDKQSRVEALIDPDSTYTIRHAGTMGRQLDKSIIDALEGSAVQGKSSGSASVALPAGQTIQGGSTGMTVDKLIQAKELLDAAEVDEMFQRHFVCAARQLRDLLGDDKVTSADFNTVQALVQGKIDEYMGFKFVRSERLTQNASTERLCYAYAQPAVLLGMGADIQTEANPRPDKRNSQQIYTWGAWGAVRVEDEMVVQIESDES